MRPLSQPERHAERIWVGPAPRTWPHVRVKHLARLYAGGTPDRENRDCWDDGTIPWLNSGAVNQWLITEPSEYITEEGFRNSSAKWIPKGALVMALAGQGKTKGMVAELAIDSTCNQSMAAIVPSERVHPRFLLYWLHANYESIRNRAGGEQRDGLNLEIVGEIPCFLPDPGQQRAIVDYLNRETVRLDALIVAKERLLDLLAEKRRALITRAVTRGLDPRAPLRDSGIPWLGEIPAHWKIDRLKFHLRWIQQGWSPMCDTTPASPEEWGVLKAGCVNGWEFDPNENKRLPEDLEPLTEYEVHPGDVLMSRANTTALLGSTALVGDVRPRLLICDKLYRLGVNDITLNREYLVMFLRSPCGRFEFERDATGASNSMQNIGQDSVRNLWLPVPPIEEQCAIVSAIKAESRKIDGIYSATEYSVRLLKERRAALIAAAVSGRLDVEVAA